MVLNILNYRIAIDTEILKDDEIPNDLKEAISLLLKYGEKVEGTKGQKKAAQKATEARSKKALEKIINAINILRMEGKSINCNSVSVVSGCSINTTTKYKEIINKQ